MKSKILIILFIAMILTIFKMLALKGEAPLKKTENVKNHDTPIIPQAIYSEKVAGTIAKEEKSNSTSLKPKEDHYFLEAVDNFSNIDDDDLSRVEKNAQARIDNEKLIERANASKLSETEMDELRILLAEVSAAKFVKINRSIDHALSQHNVD